MIPLSLGPRLAFLPVRSLRPLLRSFGLFWACVVLLNTSLRGEAPPDRPNIVLIVSDDHGTDAYGAYGNPVIRTPNLDRLAAEGILFNYGFCSAPSCSPSRAVLLTGQHSHRNGTYGLTHQEHHFASFDSVRSLPVRLAEAGYRTARVGKFHVAPESVFNFQFVGSPGEANDPATIGRSPVEMAEVVRDFLMAPDPAPFFLYFATDDPHRSNHVLPGGTPSFETYPEPNLFGNRPAGYPGIEPHIYRPDEVRVPPFLPDAPVVRRELAEYYQSVDRLDQGVGHLLSILRESGREENTVVIYLSDNGIAFPAAKTNLYDSGIRLPLVARYPRGGVHGRTESAMVSWTDVTPTLLDAAGVPFDGADMDGRSFWPVLKGEHLEGWDRIFASHSFHQVTMYYPMRAVRTRDYKLIYNLAWPLSFPMARDLQQSPTWIGTAGQGSLMFGGRTVEDFRHRPMIELYDLNQDPDELINLADDPAYAEVKAALLQQLSEFQTATKDPWLYKWDYE